MINIIVGNSAKILRLLPISLSDQLRSRGAYTRHRRFPANCSRSCQIRGSLTAWIIIALHRVTTFPLFESLLETCRNVDAAFRFRQHPLSECFLQ